MQSVTGHDSSSVKGHSGNARHSNEKGLEECSSLLWRRRGSVRLAPLNAAQASAAKDSKE